MIKNLKPYGFEIRTNSLMLQKSFIVKDLSLTKDIFEANKQKSFLKPLRFVLSGIELIMISQLDFKYKYEVLITSLLLTAITIIRISSHNIVETCSNSKMKKMTILSVKRFRT